MGIELELLAPPRRSRRRLADEIAGKIGGRVAMNWHYDSDRSQHPEFGSFAYLTPAFDVIGRHGRAFVRLADDATIVTDLDRTAPGAQGWRRLLAGDREWLNRLKPYLAPLADLDERVAEAAAALDLRVEPRGRRLCLLDGDGGLVAEVAGVTGERPRVAEAISPPLTSGVETWVELVIGTADELDFGLPIEGATHLHYDAEPFRTPAAFRRLVLAFSGDLADVRRRFASNTNCRGIGPLDPALAAVVQADDYDGLSWEEVRQRCRATGVVTKYCDVNLQHILADVPRIDTVEFRMLPATLDPAQFAHLHGEVEALIDSIVAPD
ncbi:MAG: amidoligase family protein [Actinomycetota bacterium]